MSEQDATRTAGRGGLAVTGAKVYFILLGLVQQIALPRVLGLDGYGALSRVLSIASITYNPVTTMSIQAVSRTVAVRDVYDLELKELKSFDPALMYSAVAESEVDVISAFSTDGRIAAYELTVLDDPRNALPPYDAVLLLSPKAAKDATLIKALQPLIGSIDDDTMREANKIVDVDRKTVREAANFLQGRLN
jgi:hypothetical protein